MKQKLILVSIATVMGILVGVIARIKGLDQSSMFDASMAMIVAGCICMFFSVAFIKKSQDPDYLKELEGDDKKKEKRQALMVAEEERRNGFFIKNLVGIFLSISAISLSNFSVVLSVAFILLILELAMAFHEDVSLFLKKDAKPES